VKLIHGGVRLAIAPVILADYADYMDPRKTSFAIDLPSTSGFLAAYFPIHDPLIPISLLSTYEAAKVDVVELGIRTDEPFADGAIIAASMQRSGGVGTLSEARGAIEMVRAFEHRTLGMVFAYAETKLAPVPSEWAGVDGFLGLGDASSTNTRLTAEARAHGTRITKFVPYHLPQTAMVSATKANGFVMLQYSEGKTGLRSAIDPELPARLRRLRESGVTRPILTGIGVSQPDQVRHAMDNGADGVVFGSILVQKALEGHGSLEDTLGWIREALDGS